MPPPVTGPPHDGSVTRSSSLALPRFDEPEPAGGLPIVASLVPLVVAAAIWWWTRSPFALLFAVMSPLAAIGSLVDRRVRRRRERRRALARYRERLQRLGVRIQEAQRAERERTVAGSVDPWRIRAGAALPTVSGLVWGSAVVPSGIDVEDPDDPPPGEVSAEAAALAARAGRMRAPLVTEPVHDIAIAGPLPIALPVARWLAVQLALSHPGGLTAGPPGSGILVGHDPPEGPDDVRIRHVEEGIAIAADAVLRLGDGVRPASLELRGRAVEATDLEPGMLSTGAALAALDVVREQIAAEPPTEVTAGELAELPDRAGVLAAPIGRTASGPIWLDLVRDGPHAVIGGTTGSGKSELLVGWVLAMAERHPPHRVGFLLIDFKGASAFAPLRDLPHVVGVVSDLDGPVARRAAESLRSELHRRERLFADAGARDIEHAPDLARLVVVVDEYAALVAEHPELHELIGDLASRGRSLGIHLILCSQRPGVMRDAVLANSLVRIALRVNNRADSIALVGTDAAARSGSAPPGRGLVALDGADPVAVQFARTDAADVARALALHRGASSPSRPWAEPLPDLVTRAELPPGGDGAAFGLVDLPEQQRLSTARYVPDRDGSLLVVGGRGAGTTTALAALAAGLKPRIVVVPVDLPDAWSTLRSVLDAEQPDATVLVVDDVDRLIDRADEDTRAGLLRLLAGIERELAVRGGGVILGASRAPSAATALLSRMDSRLLLRLPDREQHLMAGGAAAEWDPRRPPGRGVWHGREVQVANGESLPEPRILAVPAIELRPGESVALATGNVESVAARLTGSGIRVLRVADAAGPGDGAVILGDPDEWVDGWAALETARRTMPFLVHATPASELRSLGRVRADPPPLDPRGHEAWLLRGRVPERVRLPWLAAASARP